MATSGLRIGIVGCGPAAMVHADRLLAIECVTIVGCVDADPLLARSLVTGLTAPCGPVPAFEELSEFLRQVSPDALVIATPDHSHYRSAMEGLQAGCHLLLATPLSTNVQEAVDIVGLARARDRVVVVGHGFRRARSLVWAKELIAGGAIGRLRLITSTLTANGSIEPRIPQRGILGELGVDWIDALLWTSGGSAETVSAIQLRDEHERNLVTVSSIRLVNGVLASIAISGASSPSLEWIFHGEGGRLRAIDDSLVFEGGEGEARPIPLPEAVGDLAADFVAAVRDGSPGCCTASEALDAVRVLEAIARSAAIGQFVGLA